MGRLRSQNLQAGKPAGEPNQQLIRRVDVAATWSSQPTTTLNGILWPTNARRQTSKIKEKEEVYYLLLAMTWSLRSRWGCWRSKAAASPRQLQPHKVIYFLKPLRQKKNIDNEHKKTNKNLTATDNCVQPSSTRFKPCWINGLSNLSSFSKPTQTYIITSGNS
jgi:hypothetical protein